MPVFAIAGFTGAATAATATHLVVTVGPPSTVAGGPNVASGTPVTVTVTAVDSAGATATGYTGTVALTSNNSPMPPAYTFTLADGGVHTFSVTFVSGCQWVAATDQADPSITGASPVRAMPGATTQLSFWQSPSAASTAAGAPFPFTLQPLDASGHASSAYHGRVHFAAAGSGAELPADFTFTPNDVFGHFFTALFPHAGSFTLTAADDSVPPLTATLAVDVWAPGPAATFQVSTAGPLVAGQANQLFVEVLDAAGHIVSNYGGTVHFTSSDAAAKLPGDYTFNPIDRGFHAFSFTPGTGSATGTNQTITVTDTAPSGISTTVTLLVTTQAGLQPHFFLSQSAPSIVTGGQLLFTVVAEDAAGNPLPYYAGTVQISSSDGAATLPAQYTFGPSDAGIHGFSATLQTVGLQTITVTDAAHAITGSLMVNVVAIPPVTAFSLDVSAATVAEVGTLLAGFSATALSSTASGFFFPASWYRGTTAFSSTDAAASLPAPYTWTAADAGNHDFSNQIAFETPGCHLLTMRDTQSGGVVGRAAFDVYAPTAAASVAIASLYGGRAASGAPTPFNVSAFDAAGHAIGYGGTVHVTSSDPAAVLPADASFPSNSPFTTVLVTLHTLGPQTVTVTASSNPALTASEDVLVVPPGPATSFGVSAVGSVAAGASDDVQVTARDLTFAPATSYVGTVHFTSSDAGATLPPDYTFTAADNGVHDFAIRFSTPGVQTVTVVDTASAWLTGQTAVTVTAAQTGGGGGSGGGGGAGGGGSGGGGSSGGGGGAPPPEPAATGSPPPAASTAPCTVSASADACFVAQAYVDLLHRAADPSGSAWWQFVLGRGATHRQVAAAVIASAEARSLRLNALYESLLGRAADAGATVLDLADLASGRSFTMIEADILGSPEYFNKAGGTNDAWIAAIYHDLLGRAPDAGGEALFSFLLGRGASRTALASAVLAGTEYDQRLVADDFAVFLRRGVDPGGLASEVASLRGGATPEQLDAAIVGSDEYNAAAGSATRPAVTSPLGR